MNWYVDYDGIDGSFEFHEGEEPKALPYGQRHGPFENFGAAKRELIKLIKADMDEVKLSLAYARQARPPRRPLEK